MLYEFLPIDILKKLDNEYIDIIKPIITNKEFISRKNYHHHEHRSVYGHSLLVSFNSYNLAKKLRGCIYENYRHFEEIQTFCINFRRHCNSNM